MMVKLFFFSAPQIQNLDLNSSPVLAASEFRRFSLNCSDEMMLSPIHGFFCVMNVRIVNGKKRKTPVICNPTTSQYLPLPKVKTNWVGVTSYFRYDPIDKQFKVLSMTSKIGAWEFCEHQVLTLGGTGKLSWRMIKCCIPHYSSDKGICINGVLYYPATQHKSGLDNYIIVCFAVRSETFSFIKVKHTDIRSVCEAHRATLINYGGKLGLLTMEDSYPNGPNRRFELRILQDAEKHIWSEHKYKLSESCQEITGDRSLDFVGVLGTNEIVFLSLTYYSNEPFYIFYYNIEGNTMVRVEIQGLYKSNYKRFLTFLNHDAEV